MGTYERKVFLYHIVIKVLAYFQENRDWQNLIVKSNIFIKAVFIDFEIFFLQV